ncbi:MAG: prepilin peptidase [Thermococcus sp.]|uniref:A24 family peptidase C-terminal domain-containing protein n=1 Tax=Thermococcus sp. TaxID=35749 RepID=UPI001E0E8716|nr:A24 family peptidase C-terminal domain-containing protein [Thermococcus sp.]MBO8175663.1 prepilin peptidase [Thermococcus sp.]
MELFLVALGVIMGILTSYTDIKTGFIDDKHVFPFVALGIVYYMYKGLKVGDLFYAFSGLMGLGAGFLLGYFMYLMGGWASGDVVILAGYSALFPYASEFAKIKAPYAVYYPLHALTLLFNSIIGVFPFLFIYALGGLIVKKKIDKLKIVFTENLTLTIELALWIMVSLGLFIALQYYFGITLHPLIRWIGTLVILGILGKYKKASNILGTIMLAVFTYIVGFVFLLSFAKLLIVFYIFKVFFSIVKVLREEILIEKKPVENLKEWDILGEWIYEKNGEILRDRESFIDKFKKALATGNLSLLKPHYEGIIASPTAEGLTKEQIEKLKKLVEEGKLENEFIVRKAMPFAPALFLGFLISVFYGDLFWLLLQKMSGL